MSDVTSLAERRRQHNQQVSRGAKPLEERIRELEEDTLRLIDLVLDQERRLENQEKYLRKLVSLLNTR